MLLLDVKKTSRSSALVTGPIVVYRVEQKDQHEKQKSLEKSSELFVFHLTGNSHQTLYSEMSLLDVEISIESCHTEY